MKRLLLLLLLLLCPAAIAPLWAQSKPAFLVTSDRLSFEDKNQASIDLLTKTLPTVNDPKVQAEIYWRFSRDTLHLTDDLRSASESSSPASSQSGAGETEKLLAMYKQGEAYADRAISLDPSNAEGYFWKASNIGRWGQARGILASLFQADPMRRLLDTAAHLDPSLGDVWFVLAQLYSQVPGFPLSFGNTVWAVSLGRKAIDARTAELTKGLVPDVPEDYYVQLANELAKRGWSAAKREAEHGAQAQKYSLQSDIVEKSFYYEGSVPIAKISDRQEAIDLVQKVVDTLLAVANRTASQNRDLAAAQADLYEWTRSASP